MTISNEAREATLQTINSWMQTTNKYTDLHDDDFKTLLAHVELSHQLAIEKAIAEAVAPLNKQIEMDTIRFKEIQEHGAKLEVDFESRVAEKCQLLVEALQIWKEFPHSMPAHCHSCEAHSYLAIRATEEALTNHTKSEGKKK